MDEADVLRPGRKRTAAALVAVLALIPLGVWTQRKPIARGFVDRELAARRVPARYVISDLGPGRQRLTGVVIGDPAAPDLTADAVELRIGYGFGWPRVVAVTARGVRLRGRLADGTLSLGAIDRLLPGSTGAAFTLPDIAVDLADTRVDLATPAGAVVAQIAGRGNLVDGFAGRIAAAAARLTIGGCRVERPSAAFAVRIADRRPSLSGPLRAAQLDCAGARLAAPRLIADALLGTTLVPEQARVTLVAGAAAGGGVTTRTVRGSADYAAQGGTRRGDFTIAASDLAFAGHAAEQVRAEGDYRDRGAAAGDGRLLIGATVTARKARIAAGLSRTIAQAGAAGGGSPLGPILAAWTAAVVRAGRQADLDADMRYTGRDLTTGDLSLSRAGAHGGSGMRLGFGGGAGARLALREGRPAAGSLRVDGTATLSGGGGPDVRVALRQAAAGLTGEARIAPYAAGGARLALAPARFVLARGRDLRFATAVTIDAPVGDGAVRGLTVPVTGRYADGLVVNPACVPLRFTSLALAGVRLGATRLPLCPVGGAMLRVAAGKAGGGMMLAQPRLAGRVGQQPLTIAGRDLRVTIGRPGFAVDRLAVRLGGERGTVLDVARLDGAVMRHGVAGRFTDAAGRIANVPLLLSGGAGGWQLAGGRLDLDGRLTVADADPAPRFMPLVAPDVRLSLVGGAIVAGGTLREPKSGLAISDVTLAHDLKRGVGNARLGVPGITFGPAFQPEALTRLTLGVIANVAGTVKGAGAIDWGAAGVTSSGDFATDGIDLAAVFGPVTGIRGGIHFSDLLGLVTPPGQIVTVAAFNPGIAVEGGVVGYQLLPGQKVAVGGGKWPFSGGSLILEPTILDFGQPVERRMTFRVEGLQAGEFLQRFDFKNITLSGTFDGSLPMIFDQAGGRISGGRLVVRKGGGTLAYVGELTQADLGLFGKLAFDALKSIRYDNLAIELDGALDSEIVSRIVFTGVNESLVPARRSRGLLRNLTGLPFRFNIVVRAPFRGLTSSAEAFVNPGQLLGRAVDPPVAVQPPSSEDKR